MIGGSTTNGSQLFCDGCAEIERSEAHHLQKTVEGHEFVQISCGRQGGLKTGGAWLFWGVRLEMRQISSRKLGDGRRKDNNRRNAWYCRYFSVQKILVRYGDVATRNDVVSRICAGPELSGCFSDLMTWD